MRRNKVYYTCFPSVYMIVASECVVLNAMKAAFDLGLLKDGKIQYVFITFFFYLGWFGYS